MIYSTVIKKLEFEPKTRPGTLGVVPSLEQCQFKTPPKLVKFVWKLAMERRHSINNVIDLGAGDGVFASGGKYQSYVGYEIDSDKYGSSILPSKARIIHSDIIFSQGKFDLAIGNPPFIRHQDVNDIWKSDAKKIIKDMMSVEVSGQSNLYQYFMWISIMRTTDDGIVSLIVPFEWTFRPSSQPLRNFIKKNNWKVEVFKLPSDSFFEGIAAVPSVTIIDKARKSERIKIIEVKGDLEVSHRSKDDSYISNQFEFYKRNSYIYAQRGFSTGSQEYFVLTDEERKKNKISLRDVVPCVTTLRPLSLEENKLSKTIFRTHYVKKGYKCWLIRTDRKVISIELERFLDTVPRGIRENWTCRNRSPWYFYKMPKSPQILYSSSFIKGTRPKMVINEISARNISSVQGVFLKDSHFLKEKILSRLKAVDFSVGTFPTINGLRKVEVRQMNGILNKLESKG